MAQRTVHYVFAQHLAASCGISDRPRFLLGSLLPDAIGSKSERDVTHYVHRGEDGTRFYDYDRFRCEFSERMPRDPLCLGYYMHLVEDNFYRRFCHEDYNFYFITDKEVRSLHRDYHLLNPFLIERYGLKNELVIPPDLAGAPLARIAHFDLAGLRADLDQDFSEQPQGKYHLMTPEIMEGFVEQTLPLIEAELRAVLQGGSCFRAADFAWKRENG